MPVTNAASSAAVSDQAQEVVITRVFDAPRSVVFKAWTDPKQVKEWWGPHRFTNPICEVEARPGGAIRIDMLGPDGTVYPMGGRFHEILEPERLVFTTNAFDGKLEVRNTVTFADEKGKTKVTLHAVVVKSSPETAEALSGMREGWSQSLEKLQDLLPSTTADREIVATRVFDAPRDFVFSLWTEPKHIERWWGPRGFTTTTYEMDFRPGGVWRHVMHGPDGRDYPNKVVYREIVRPERIVYSHVSGPPFESTVTFREENGQTRVRVRMLFESAEL